MMARVSRHSGSKPRFGEPGLAFYLRRRCAGARNILQKTNKGQKHSLWPLSAFWWRQNYFRPAVMIAI